MRFDVKQVPFIRWLRSLITARLLQAYFYYVSFQIFGMFVEADQIS